MSSKTQKQESDQVNEETASSHSSTAIAQDSSSDAAPSFTQGPWKVNAVDGLTVYAIRDELSEPAVAVCGHIDAAEPTEFVVSLAEQFDNARLIAAAPTMYETLLFLRRVCAACDIPRIDAALALANGQVNQRG